MGDEGFVDDSAGQGDVKQLIHIKTDLGQALINAHIVHFGNGDVFGGTPEDSEKKKEQAFAKLKELCAELVKFLEVKADIMSGMKDNFLKQHNIKIAPLEISTQSRDFKQIDESGHFHHREDILQVFNKAPSGNIDHSDLFEAALKQAKAQAEIVANNPHAKENYILTHGNIVGVTGHAGIGKTTLTKLLVQKGMTGKLYDVDYVFYLRFRDIGLKQKVNLLQFLTNNHRIFAKENKEHVSALLEVIDQSNRVLIVMDGFDEAALDGMDQHFIERCSIHEEVEAQTFIKNILCGNILPRAKKLITSRPRQMHEMHEDYKPTFMVNVLGLNKTSQEQICGDIVNNTEDLKKRILEFLQNHPDLSSYCYVPVNCILIMFCINANFNKMSKDPMETMDSLTTIMVAALGLFIENGYLRCDIPGQKIPFQIENLCRLAYNGFMANQLYFDRNDLDDANINKENANAFLTVGIGSNDELTLWDGAVETKFYFTHLILQEFCVAVYMKLYLSIGEFKELVAKLENSRYQMVTKLLFGLCNCTTLKYLANLHKRSCDQELSLKAEDDEASKKQLQSLVLEHLKKLSRGTTKKYVFNVFQICTWVYEMRDDSFTEQVVSALQDKLVVTGEILPNDIPGFYYMLRFKKENPLTLSVVAPSFVEEALKRFFVEMDRIFTTTKIKITKLKFKSDNVGDDGAEHIATCLYKIDQLYLVACPITETGLESLADAIKKNNPPLKRLDLCAITIEDNGAEQLKKCIHKIDRVKLQLCKLTDVGIKTLSEGIISRTSKMTELNLSEGAIGNEGAAHLAACLPQIEELKLKFCNITSGGVESLTNAISLSSLRLLDLSENIIGNDGAILLANCVKQIDELILEYCYIDAKGIEALAKAIEKRPNKMSHLFILNNKIGDDGFTSMSTCLPKIKKLSIGDCNDIYLTFKGIKAFTTELRAQEHAMSELSVCCRRCVEEKAKKELQQCKLKAEKFFFQNSPLTEN